MQIEKKALRQGLQKAQKFTGKDLPVLHYVLIDSENQQLVATDLITRFETPVTITDFEQTVPVPVVYPDEEKEAELTKLGKPELVTLAKGLTVDGKKNKSDYVDAIMAHLTAQADAQVAKKETFTVTESFCVDPKHLLKLVNSLEIKDTDMVSLVPQMTTEAGTELFENDGKATKLAVGGHFQRLTIIPKEDFPEWFDVVDAEFVVAMTGKNLALITAPCCDDNKLFYKEHVFFDSDNGNLASTDGNRMHVLKADVSQTVMINHKAITRMAFVAKAEKVDIAFSKNVSYAVLTTGDDKATVRVDSDLEFPPYMDVLTGAGQSVDIAKADLDNMLMQSILVTGEDYMAVVLTFNGGLNASVQNPNVGEYHKESVEIEGSIDPEVTLRINPRFIQDALKSISADKLTMRVNTCDHPLHLSSEDFQAIIMPVRA